MHRELGEGESIPAVSWRRHLASLEPAAPSLPRWWSCPRHHQHTHTHTHTHTHFPSSGQGSLGRAWVSNKPMEIETEGGKGPGKGRREAQVPDLE